MDALAINEKFVQGFLPWLGWSWSFSLGERGRFLAASVSSSTITIVSWVTVATVHSRTTRDDLCDVNLALLTAENAMERRKKI